MWHSHRVRPDHFELTITADADLLKLFGRRPSITRLGNTAMGSMFLLFTSKLALDG